MPDKVRAMLRRELEIIAELKYAPYFLTVHDIVSFARARGILAVITSYSIHYTKLYEINSYLYVQD